MNCYTIRIQEGTLDRMYYDSLEAAKSAFPEALSIIPNTDTSFLEYFSKIEDFVIDKLLDYRGRTVWVIPYLKSYVLVRPFFDENNNYINGCCYQINKTRIVKNTTWNLSNPKEIYDMFLKGIDEPKKKEDFVSVAQAKKAKAKTVYRKNSLVVYKDPDGYFYFSRREFLPTKKEIVEWCGLPDTAVYVSYGLGIPMRYGETKWFDSIESFFEFYKTYEEQAPGGLGIPHFDVHCKKSSLHPLDRKYVYRLPYFDIKKQYEILKRDSSNTNEIVSQMAHLWDEEIADIAEKIINLVLV